MKQLRKVAGCVADVGAFIVTGNVIVDPNGNVTFAAGQAEAVDVLGVHDELVAHDVIDPGPLIEDEIVRPFAVTNVPLAVGVVGFGTEYTPSPNSTGPLKPFIAGPVAFAFVHLDVTVTVNGQAEPGTQASATPL